VFRRGGEPYFTLDALRELLSPHFAMLDEPQNVEFVIRETRRKFQHTVAELTAWERTKPCYDTSARNLPSHCR
jgi:hypothetical protein